MQSRSSKNPSAAGMEAGALPGKDKSRLTSAASIGDSVTPVTVARSIADVHAQLDAHRKDGETAGLVPTMGFLHEGHLSLIRAARADCPLVVVSIFVNPIQFGGSEDFNTYPRDLGRDLKLAASAGAGVVFAPAEAELYPNGFDTMVVPGKIAEGLCGATRPGHFQGVATVIAKLFNIIQPSAAYFGQKDAQQVAVIKRTAADLNYNVRIRVCPTVREPDGLATSSRNSYLSEAERSQAPVLYEALMEAKAAVSAGQTGAAALRRQMKRKIAGKYLAELEYVKIVDPGTLEPVPEIKEDALAAVAARFGRARLIDNMILSPGGENA